MVKSSSEIRHGRGAAFALALASLFYGAWIVLNYQPFTFLLYDPGWTVEVVRSIHDDFDLDLRNQLKFDPAQAGDQTALGLHGEWYPVHEFFLPIAAAPFFTIWGLNGTLYFNFLTGLFLAGGCYYAAARYTEPGAAVVGALGAALAPVVVIYIYSFSTDLFGAALLVWAFGFAVRRQWVLAGLLIGSAVFGRIVNGFTLPAFCLFPIFAGSGASEDNSAEPAERLLKPVFLFFAGALPFALIFITANQLMFGGLLEVAYRHWMHPSAGGDLMVTDQTSMFDRRFFDGVIFALADRRCGLFTGVPLLPLALLFGLVPFYRRDRPAFFLWILAAAGLIAGVALFRTPFPGSLGNRYLIGIAALSAVPLALMVENLKKILLTRRANSPAAK